MKMLYDSKPVVKAVRTKRLIEWDLDIREAAKKMKISPATLSRIENGRTPDVNTLATVCYYISLPMESAFIPSNKKHSPKIVKK
jgi:transcriptional regulator with XRE-family HTH domain